VAMRSRHGLDVEEEGHLKDFIVILIFIEVFLLFIVFNAKGLFAKENPIKLDS
jgi:hypothetical protein